MKCVAQTPEQASLGGVQVPRGNGDVLRLPRGAGIQIVGTGNREQWQFPSAASYTAAGIDDKVRVLGAVQPSRGGRLVVSRDGVGSQAPSARQRAGGFR